MRRDNAPARGVRRAAARRREQAQEKEPRQVPARSGTCQSAVRRALPSEVHHFRQQFVARGNDPGIGLKSLLGAD